MWLHSWLIVSLPCSSMARLLTWVVPDSQDITFELLEQPRDKTYAVLPRQYHPWHHRIILANRKINMSHTSLTVWMNMLKSTLSFLPFQRAFEEKWASWQDLYLCYFLSLFAGRIQLRTWRRKTSGLKKTSGSQKKSKKYNWPSSKEGKTVRAQFILLNKREGSHITSRGMPLSQ